jgi:hypothetical protein
MLDLSPAVAGTAADLEFRWSLKHTLDGGVAGSAYVAVKHRTSR